MEQIDWRWHGLFRIHLPEKYIVLERVVQPDEAYGKGWALLMAEQKHSRKLACKKMPDYAREFCGRFSSQEIFENPGFYLEKSLTLAPFD